MSPRLAWVFMDVLRGGVSMTTAQLRCEALSVGKGGWVKAKGEGSMRLKRGRMQWLGGHEPH